MVSDFHINVNNEYGVLKSVLVASADTYFEHVPINNNQKLYYKQSPPKKELLLEQQKEFFRVMQKNGITLLFADRMEDCPDQLNTRDPAFVIGDTFFVSAMKESLRGKEKNGLIRIVEKIKSKIVYLQDCTIEGGDILVAGNTVYVGISMRTSYQGLQQLANFLSANYKVVPIILRDGYLHLDTVFNILSEDMALVCEEAIATDSVELIKQRYSVINISLDEQLYLGTNVLSIAPYKVITQECNTRINRELIHRGFDIIELDFSEPAKLGGAFRCGTCPLVRE